MTITALANIFFSTMRLKLPVGLLITLLSTVDSFPAESSRRRGNDGWRTKTTASTNSMALQIEAQPRQGKP